MVAQSIPKTALVVDDSMLIRHSVCRFLEERGFIVEAATNGVEALEVLGNFVPDIIITDLSMPRMGGAELVARSGNSKFSPILPFLSWQPGAAPAS